MALDLISRWRTLQEISEVRKSGTLVAQSGPTYLYWVLEEGRLVCVVSSNPELSFTRFLLSHSTISAKEISLCQDWVNEIRSLGAVLVQRVGVQVADLNDLLCRHWVSLSYYLLNSSTHIFWSERPVVPKADFVRSDIPFSHILMQSDRESVETPVALRMVHTLRPPFRMKSQPAAWEPFLMEPEKRLVPYLQSGCSITEMLRDPELDHLTCYRTLFLLWLAGLLSDSSTSSIPKSRSLPDSAFWRRVRSLPPDWIFPMLAGMLLGVVLAPSGEKHAAALPVQKLETVHEILQKPAWRADTETTEENQTTEYETTDPHR